MHYVLHCKKGNKLTGRIATNSKNVCGSILIESDRHKLMKVNVGLLGMNYEKKSKVAPLYSCWVSISSTLIKEGMHHQRVNE